MAGRLLGLAEPGSSGRGEVGFAAAATGSSAPLTARTHPPIAAPRTHLNTERPTAVVCARVHPATAIERASPPRHGRHPRWQRWGHACAERPAENGAPLQGGGDVVQGHRVRVLHHEWDGHPVVIAQRVATLRRTYALGVHADRSGIAQ